MNSSSTKRQLDRTNQIQNQKQSQSNYSISVSDETGSDAPERDEFTYLMGVCREAGLTDMGRNGSVLKALLGKYKSGELEAVIRGLRLVNDGYRSLLPLNSKQHGANIWAEAVQRYYRSVNVKPKRKRENEPTQLGAILKQLSGAA